MGGAWASWPGHVREGRREKGRRGGSVPLGFAKTREREGVQMGAVSWPGHRREKGERRMKNERKRRKCSPFLGFAQKEGEKKVARVSGEEKGWHASACVPTCPSFDEKSK
jgi:hypothetical protein